MKFLFNLFNGASKHSLLLFAMLFVSWCLIFNQVFTWSFHIVNNPAFHLNFMLLTLIGIVASARAIQCAISHRIHFEPYFNIPSILIILVSVSVHLINYHTVRISLLSAILFFAGLYGLIMIFTPSQYHHWGTMPFGLLLTTLPFSYNFNVIFGFPLRLKIAELIQSILALVGIQTVGSETIILIENRASHIDYTCSGIQGICCSFICFFALSWIERKKLSLPWFLLLAGFIIATLTGNIIRVLLLVLLYGVYNQPALADMIHILCGLLTFIVPSVIVYLLFIKTSWFPERTLQVSTVTIKKNPLAAYTLLFIFIAIIIFVPHAKNRVLLTAEQIEFSPKDGMIVKDIPLTSGENRLFCDYAVPSYCKKEFKSGNSTGSFFLIKSDHFKAHHNPQNCLQSNGLRVSDSRMFLFDINFPVRYLSLNGGSSTAYFWFTSKKTITDDYSERMWNHFFNNKEIWIMASVVFDGEYTPENKDVRTVILSLQQTINTLLERPDHGNYCFTKP